MNKTFFVERAFPSASGRRGDPCCGSALIETALVLPLLLLLMLNTVNFGLYIFGWITVDNAARAAVEYQIYNGAAIGFPTSPTFSQVTDLVTADVASLPTSATPKVTLEVCSNRNGTSTCSGTGSYLPPADPEPAGYVLYSVDIAYTYTPLFSAFDIPGLGISLTLPASTIHQQVAMRSMQ
jgi:hypothetical protein